MHGLGSTVSSGLGPVGQAGASARGIRRIVLGAQSDEWVIQDGDTEFTPSSSQILDTDCEYI